MTHRIGQQFGNYLLIRFLGRGGFADVYLGEQIYLKTLAALKILHIQLKDVQAQSFLKEARTIAHLEHPHIVQVLDFGVHEDTPFLVMRHAPNGNLRTFHPKGSRLSTETVISYVKQVASALQHAHDQRLIHCDVKPENMLLGADKEILLSDFGLAVAAQHGAYQESQKVIGTLPYMAPEQLQGKPCMASDQYALGVVVYEWLCGMQPFTGSFPEMAMQHLKVAPPSLQKKIPDLPLASEQVIFRALSKRPSQRFASIAAFASALEKSLRSTEQKPSQGPYPVQTSSLPTRPYLGRQQRRPLVGRNQEWTRLQSLLLEVELAPASSDADPMPVALSGIAPSRPTCMVLLGEAGIGKTRLVEDLSREAQQRGWAVVWSRGYEQEKSFPYQLWVELLRNVIQQGLWPSITGESTSHLPSLLSALTALLPEVADLLPISGAPSPIAAGREQLRIWEAIFALLTNISMDSPVLLILDDLHWVDKSSYDLLSYLARRLAAHRVLLVGTCRDSDLSPMHPLRTLLDTLSRAQIVETLHTPPLTTDEIGKMVADVPAPFIQYIQHNAAGNPFFAEELARMVVTESPLKRGAASLSSQGMDAVLPKTISALLDLRLNMLSRACQGLLARAAVVGGPFSLTLLRAIETGRKDLDTERILDLLEEALQAGVLSEEHNGLHTTYRFWHPLLTSHLYNRLSADRRTYLHLRTAQALQHIYADHKEEGAAAIAYHLVHGGAESSSIISYADLAGSRAYALSAYPEAEQHYRLVVERRGALAENASPDEQRRWVDILERLGECTRVQGKSELAHGYYEQALEVRQQSHRSTVCPDPQYEAQIDALLWLEMGKTWSDRGNFELATQYARQAEQVLHEVSLATGSAMASLLLQQGYSLWRTGDLKAAYQVASQALEMFREVLQHQDTTVKVIHTTAIQRTLAGDPVDCGWVHNLLGMIAGTTGNHAEALEHYNVALAIFEQHERQREIAVVCGNIGDLYMRKTDFTFAQTILQYSLKVAERIGETPCMSLAYCNLGILATRTGNLSEAEGCYRKGLSLAEQANDLVLISLTQGYLARLLMERGQFHGAREFLGRALKLARSGGSTSWLGSILIALGHLHLFEATFGEGSRAYAPKRGKSSLNETSIRFLHLAKRALQRVLMLEDMDVETRIEGSVALARVWLHVGELETAQRQAIEAMGQARHHEVTWLLIGAKQVLAGILTAREQHAQANEYFKQALEEYHTCGMHLEYARTLQEYGIALLQQGSPEASSYQEGLGYLREARQILIECQATLDLQRNEQILVGYCDTPKKEFSL